jgi:hypothetical protein
MLLGAVDTCVKAIVMMIASTNYKRCAEVRTMPYTAAVQVPSLTVFAVAFKVHGDRL